MRHNKLSNLAILWIEKKLAKEIKFGENIDQFVETKNRKTA